MCTGRTPLPRLLCVRLSLSLALNPAPRLCDEQQDAGAETELLGAPCPLGPRVAPCYGGGPGYGGGPAWPGGGPGLQPASVASVAYQGSMPPSAQAEVNYLEGTVNDA